MGRRWWSGGMVLGLLVCRCRIAVIWREGEGYVSLDAGIEMVWMGRE
jgi:hypothetical protein